MAAGKHLGEPVLDELRICYAADPLLLADLSRVEVGDYRTFPPFTLFRIGGDRFEFMFAVCEGEPGDWKEVGQFKFGRYGAGKSHLCYLRVSNQVLYDQEQLRAVLSFPDMLSLVFNNFTAIDIAIDHRKNISSIIKRLMRNEDIKTILNGKQVKDRSKVIPGVTIDYSTSLKRLQCPTITIRQAKAIKNKDKGITVQSYDKKAEVETGSGKQYILDYYDQPRYLFRLEVRLRYQELRDYCRLINTVQGIDMVFDPEFLKGLYYYHLSAVIRFTKGRKMLAWPDLIDRNGRV